MGDTVTCAAVRAECRCIFASGHDGPHECDCDGSWIVAADGGFETVRFPDVTRSPLWPTFAADPETFAFMAMVAANGPVSVPRGPIRYITPPWVAEHARAKEAELLAKMRVDDE